MLLEQRTNELLGYPPEARLLILNADDFGMYPAVNAATFRTLREGVVSSTSVIVPSPWSLQAMQLLREYPEISSGVHLTVISDLANSRWAPLTPREKVPSLVDEVGRFYSLERMVELLAQARLEELELEFRAQIEAVLAARLRPTHLDWHCLHSGGRADIFDLTLDLAKEHGLAVRVAGRSLIEKLQSQGLPTDDHELLDSFDVETADKSARYAQLLRDLPVGLSEWAVHPSLGNEESQAIDPGGWWVRKTDFDFLISPQAHQLIRQEGIVVLSYRPLQKAWRG